MSTSRSYLYSISINKSVLVASYSAQNAAEAKLAFRTHFTRQRVGNGVDHDSPSGNIEDGGFPVYETPEEQRRSSDFKYNLDAGRRKHAGRGLHDKSKCKRTQLSYVVPALQP
jgi:hypothetical protein